MTPGMDWQVCSLDWSKRLRDLGVKQEAAFYWLQDWDQSGAWVVTTYKRDDGISAFTVAELGQLIKANSDGDLIQDLFFENVKPTLIREGIDTITADTEANARAAMLCHLIENKIVTP